MLVGPLRGETMECGAFLFQLGEQRLALHDCKDRRRREQQHAADGDQPGRAFEEAIPGHGHIETNDLVVSQRIDEKRRGAHSSMVRADRS